ncbi:MAG: 1-phosphofructokinase family hexose kinase [Acetobacteraceae bacterium]|nr:1-phosphofructokinase family hexose kinase [Acetobacteraceae bacterium]
MKPIVTLTLNPAVDIACATEKVVPQDKLRTHGDRMDPGGGGVNVARVLQELGAETCAVVLAGGVFGRQLEALIAAEGVAFRTVPIAGTTRIAFTVHDERAGQEYRFVGEGPEVLPGEIAACREIVAATECDWLVISGSLPRGVAPETLAGIVRHAHARGRKVVVDTSGPALAAVLGQGPALIKPSLREFEALVGRALPDPAEQEAEALRLVREGAAERIAVSLSGAGALLATRDGVVRRPAIPVRKLGTVGAGDSFVAAMVLALARDGAPADALAWGLAAGAAAVMATGTARPRRETIEALRARV